MIGFMLALLAAAPFLVTMLDPGNSHFARESLLKDLPAQVKRALPHPELAKVLEGPLEFSLDQARDYARKEKSRYLLYAQCGLVIEALKQCDAHIKYCAHSCELWVFETDGMRQLGHARVPGDKGGTDAVKNLLQQLIPALEPLQQSIRELLVQQDAERQAALEAERVGRDLKLADAERAAAAQRVSMAVQAAQRAQDTAARAGDEQARKAAEKATRVAAQEAERERILRDRAAALALAEEQKQSQQADQAGRALAAQRQKRLAAERAVMARVIHLVPGQTVAVLEVENDLSGGARNQVNSGTVTDNLRQRVQKAGLGLLVMDRDAILQILTANEKKVLDCQANCETLLGGILRADYVISARLARDKSKFKLALLMYRSKDGALLSDASALSDDLAGLDRKAAAASTDLLSVFPVAR